MNGKRGTNAVGAAALVILSAVIYGVSPTLMKLTYALGGSGTLSALYTSLFAAPMLWLWAKGSGVSLRVRREEALPLAALSLSTGATSVLLYTSYSFIPVGLSTALHFVYPAATALYLAAFFHTRLGALSKASLALAVMGVACTAASATGGVNLIGVALAVASGFTWAFYIVCMDKSGLAALPPAKLNFYMALANVVCSGAMCLTTGTLRGYDALWPWGIMLGVALVHRVVGNACFQTGIRGVSAFSASIYSTFEPATSVLMGILVLHEHLTRAEQLGLALILAGVLCNVLAARRGE